MKILVGHECSGRVRDAFRRRGHDAWSCDLLPAEDGGPHLLGDVEAVLGDGWDMAIFFPTCTYLAGSGLHWNNRGRGHEKTLEALAHVRRLLDAPIPRIALENPVGRIGTAIRKPSQTIQPYDFGEDASKRTCLWLKGLPPLRPTKRIPGRIVEWPRGSGKMVERWSNQTDSGQNALGPSDTRWLDRARTYPGIAEAMADQWGQVRDLLAA